MSYFLNTMSLVICNFFNRTSRINRIYPMKKKKLWLKSKASSEWPKQRTTKLLVAGQILVIIAYISVVKCSTGKYNSKQKDFIGKQL